MHSRKELYDLGILKEPEKTNKLSDGLFYIFLPFLFFGLLFVLIVFC